MDSKVFSSASSISEYLNVIKKNSLNNHISRGESEKYNEPITATTFRKNQVENEKIQAAKKMKEFFNYTISTLDSYQAKHFLAFAQHYGLETYLIDFSYMPLISLFFACKSSRQSYEKAGYVYFLNKNKIVDITNIVMRYQWQNIFEFLFISPMDIFDKFHSVLLSPIPNQYMTDCILNLLNIINKWIINSNPKTASAISLITKHFELDEKQVIPFDRIREKYEFNDKIGGFTIFSAEKIVVDILSAIKPIVLNGTLMWENFLTKAYFNYIESLDNSFVPYQFTLALLALLDYFFKYENDIEVPILFAYHPPEVIARLKSQHSLFIYQLAYYHKEIPIGFSTRKRQIIKPDFTIRIENQEEILKDLDFLGVNERTIFGDYDSIAKYIKAKSY